MNAFLLDRRTGNILLLSFVLCAVAFSSERKVKSKVTAVTVYSDRALVTRTAHEELSTGVYSIVFADLPVALVDQSIRVMGDAEGRAKILDVKIETVFLDTIPEDRVRQLQDRLKQLRYEEQTLVNRQSILRSQMNLVDSLRTYYPRDARNMTFGQKSTFDEWDKMLAFLEKNLTLGYSKMLETNAKLEEVRGRIVTLNNEIAQSRGYSRKSMKQVRVELDVARAGFVNLNLAYLLPGARWSPQYEARVGHESASMQFAYMGSVWQATGEDWDNIELTLSTAQPASESVPAELYPWVLDISQPQAPFMGGSTARVRMQVEKLGQGGVIRGSVREKGSGQALVGVNVALEGLSFGAPTDVDGNFVIHNVPSGAYSVRATYIGYQPFTLRNVQVVQTMSSRIDFELVATAVQMSEVAVLADRIQSAETVTRNIELETAQVTTQATSAVFKIPSRPTVPSDNNPHKVGIMVGDLPVKSQYVAIPKLSPDAYLKGKAKNNTEFPFLAGPMNVFFENSFVAASEIKTTFPQEEFDAFLGIDEGIRIDRKLINRFTEYTGTFTKQVKVTYEFLTSVQNLKTTSVNISIQDQIPISRNEKILVEQLEPDSKAMPANATGVLKWDLQLKPNDKSTFKLKFSVEYPRDIHVGGLE
jgi:hypothetical protein